MRQKLSSANREGELVSAGSSGGKGKSLGT